MATQTTAPSVNASVTQEVKLTPSQKRRLLTELKTMEVLHDQKKALEKALEVHKSKVDTIRVEVGAEKIEVEGFKVAFVQPVRTSLDKELLLKAGCSMAQIEAGTKTVPVKSYTKVSYPNEKERD